VEVATFRSDASYSDGRRPDAVRFETDPRQDVLRRDFTINACCSIRIRRKCWITSAGARTWKPRDPRHRRSGGAFREDHLRLLRAVRFAARLGFEIEPGDHSRPSSAARR
jgi:tRNA nucleotidyltransferase/poly(A) polymerase